MMCAFSLLARISTPLPWLFVSRFFSVVGTRLFVLTAALIESCRNQGKDFFQPSPLETVSRLVLLNIMLQAFDGLATYYGLSLGMQEGNPVMRAAMVQW